MRKANTENIVLAVVSNIPYKSMPSAFLTNCFNTLPEKDKSIICKALMSELQLKEIDLSKVRVAVGEMKNIDADTKRLYLEALRNLLIN